jgi:hypothetical protein
MMRVIGGRLADEVDVDVTGGSPLVGVFRLKSERRSWKPGCWMSAIPRMVSASPSTRA